MIFIMCGIFRSLSRRRRGLSRRRRGRVATRRAAVTVCRGVSRVSRAIFFLSKPRHVLGHPSQGGVSGWVWGTRSAPNPCRVWWGGKAIRTHCQGRVVREDGPYI